MITEGTYPCVLGGVSSWCEALIGGLPEIQWDVLPIVAGDKRRRQLYALPPNARLQRPIELWSEGGSPPMSDRRRRTPATSLPTELLRGLMPWEGDLQGLTSALVRCRERPQEVRPAFRSRGAWEEYLHALAAILREPHDDAAADPIYDALEAARLYQMLYWVARTAAVPTPASALVHATAAGWSAIPALVDKALNGTPVLLTEHGIYVREAYLASIRDFSHSPARHHMSTRMARGLTRAAYAMADVIAPVTESHVEWERSLGGPGLRIRGIPNGIDPPGEPSPPPNAARVVAMGRIDPLKDVMTMMLVADEVTRRMPEARFEYWGPPTPGEEDYAAACALMRERLGLGERFRFMGRTTEPQSVLCGCDLVLLTSISEGMPMALLEAMALGRTAVATAVGGVPGVLRGCGLLASPGDVHGLAAAVLTLLRRPDLAARLGRRAYVRVVERYTQARCVDSYRELIEALVGEAAT